MRKRILIYLLIPILVGSCTSKELKADEIKKSLEELSSLGTVEYDLSKLLIVDDEQWFAIGERKAIINLKANIVAGVDFKKIKIKNIKKKDITILMPDAEIIYLNIPPDKINFAVLKSSFLRDDFSNNELNKIQILGEKDIKKKIKQLGILKEASKNATELVKNWLKMVGFEKIEIV